jgi:hypothetical protein
MPRKHNALTIADLAERAIGYAPSGESKHTRRVSAPGGADPSFNRERQSWSRLDVMAAHERKVVARLERRATEARGGPQYGPICIRLQRTRHLLARLKAEQKGLL